MYYIKVGLDLTPAEMEKLEEYLERTKLSMPQLVNHLVKEELREERIIYDGHD